ncbi:MAG: ABC transporter ATP-binding protein [Anaerolineae bacterium]|nr:ABC transporter ATP-binding protein [Anaerolineae bacterium]
MSMLAIKNLTVVIDNKKQTKIVEDVSLKVDAGEIVGLVGASGSGKTTTGYSILGLLDPALAARHGEIIFKGKNLLRCSEDYLRKVRGGQISMIFQEPLNAFNPVFSLGYQIDEMLQFHTDLRPEGRQQRILELLDLVGLPDPQRIMKNYPHQLSGGMRQRAMIAQAIAANPSLIIADEPTSSLDVTLQARVIELFQHIRKELGLSFLLITHDLGMVGHLCDRVAVMCEGKIVETGSAEQVIEQPQHEYTKRLLGALKLT